MWTSEWKHTLSFSFCWWNVFFDLTKFGRMLIFFNHVGHIVIMPVFDTPIVTPFLEVSTIFKVYQVQNP
jgi:hypothetical protein